MIEKPGMALPTARATAAEPEVSALRDGIANAATIDSEIYRKTFYGILNKHGEFWTPLAFETKADATRRLDKFWGEKGWHPRHFKIVPVRIHLATLPPEKE